MKRITTLVLLLFLTACGSPTEESVITNERFSGESITSGTDIIIDDETGCKYMFHKQQSAAGLSPLYKADGEIDCGE